MHSQLRVLLVTACGDSGDSGQRASFVLLGEYVRRERRSRTGPFGL